MPKDTQLSLAGAPILAFAQSSVVSLGALTLDLARGRLTGPQGDIALRAKSFGLLAHLARNRGRVIAKDELIAAVWPDVTVSDESLTQCVHDLRRALGADGPQLLRTVPRRGYMLVAQGPLAVSTPVPGSIAVLPFALQGPDAPRDQVLFDGLAHDVTGRLARLRAFHVIGRGSAFALRHMADAPVDLGRALNIAYAVTGRAIRRADRFRLHVDLLDCRDGRLIWSDAFDMAAPDVMRAADQLPDPIVAALADEITLSERHRAAIAPENLPPDAWRSFHTGLNLLFQSGEDVLDRALDQFALATTLDAGFARAHAFASFCHFNFAIRRFGPNRTAATQAAHAASSRALAQDDGSPAAHWAHGRALWLNRHAQAGLRQVRHAIAICPSFPHAHYMAGFIEAHQGDAAQALRDLNRAQALSPCDPFLASLQVAKATAFARTGDDTSAVAMAAQAASQCAEFDQLQCHAALILAGLGEVTQARAILATAPVNEPAFRPDMLHATIYDMPGDIRHVLQTGAQALGLPQL